jgi:adenosylcobinamide-GDP ribazoletransferase
MKFLTALPAGQPLYQLLEPAQGAGRLGESRLPLDGGGAGLQVGTAELTEQLAELIETGDHVRIGHGVVLQAARPGPAVFVGPGRGHLREPFARGANCPIRARLRPWIIAVETARMPDLFALARTWWCDFAVALAFLTRAPLLVRDSHAAGRDLARALRLAPLVGVLLGLLAAAVFWIARALGLPPGLAGLLAVAAGIWATGALHEDGLADTADGFGGAFEKARKLAIMRDSRSGAFGVLALVFSVALRAGALAALAEPVLVAAALVAAHAASRGLFPAFMFLLPQVRPDGLAASAGRPLGRDVLLGLALALVVAVAALGLPWGLAMLLAVLLAALFVALLARAQIGGYTGDVLGAMQQTAETAALLTLVALV